MAGSTERRHGEQAEDVGLELIADLLVVAFLDRRLVAVAGIVDEHIDAAEAVLRGLYAAADIWAESVTSRSTASALFVAGDQIGDARLVARGDDGRPAAGNGEFASSRPKPVEQPVMNQTGCVSWDIGVPEIWECL
jgi:hypothetical protein